MMLQLLMTATYVCLHGPLNASCCPAEWPQHNCAGLSHNQCPGGHGCGGGLAAREFYSLVLLARLSLKEGLAGRLPALVSGLLLDDAVTSRVPCFLASVRTEPTQPTQHPSGHQTEAVRMDRRVLSVHQACLEMQAWHSATQ